MPKLNLKQCSFIFLFQATGQKSHQRFISFSLCVFSRLFHAEQPLTLNRASSVQKCIFITIIEVLIFPVLPFALSTLWF